jgi:tRNA(Ile)-lysidine synthase
MAIEQLLPSRRNIMARHIENLLGLMNTNGNKGSSEIHLPQGLMARKEYDKIVISYGKSSININMTEQSGHVKDITVKKSDCIFDIKIDSKTPYVPQDIDIKNLGIMSCLTFPYQKNENIPQKAYTKWFDYDRITTCAVFRLRRPGDYLVINRDGQRKKLKKYLINEKVPKSRRENMFVLADDSHIMWVPGLRISEYYKVTDSTATILEVRLLPAQQCYLDKP